MKVKWFVLLLVVAIMMMLVPATVGAEDPVPNYGFIPNSGEASVSKVDLVNMEEVARYYTAPRDTPDPYDWRTSRIAMDADGNAWVLNTGADGTGLRGSVVRILADTDGLVTHAYPDPVLDFGTDEAVEVFPVGALGEIPRAIAIDADGYIWVGFYSGGYLAKYSFDGTSLTLEDTFRLGDGTANNIKFYEMKFAPEVDGHQTLWISSRSSTPTRPGVQGVYSFDGTSFTLEWATNPYALLIDPVSGEVFATSYSNVIWRSSTKATTTIPGATNLRGMAFDENGVIWIANTAGGSGGNKVFSFDPSSNLAGAVYTLTVGNTPVGVGRDEAGLMWAICRTDNQAQGYIEAIDVSGALPVHAGDVEVGYRPYAYGDFIVPPPPEYSICGYKFEAVWDEELEEYICDVGIEGWEITLQKLMQDPENVGEWIVDPSFAPIDKDTDSDGKYCFDGLLAGKYRVTEGTMPGWTPVDPTYHDVMLPGGETDLDADEPMLYNFCNEHPKYSICGYKFEAVWDEALEELVCTEIPISGWEITLEKLMWDEGIGEWVVDPSFDPVVEYTDIDGRYCFDGLLAGTYRVTEEQVPGYNPAGPTHHDVTLPGGETDLDADEPMLYNFCNEPPQLVCGDETVWAAMAHPGENRFSNANNWGTFVWYEKGDGTEGEPVAYPLYAGQDYLAGMLYAWDDGDTLFVRYTTEIPQDLIDHCIDNGGKIFEKEGVCDIEWTGILEYHLAVADDQDGIPRTTTGRNKVLSNPIPGNFMYKDNYDSAVEDTDWIEVDISGLDGRFVIAAHGVMQWCGYECLE